MSSTHEVVQEVLNDLDDLLVARNRMKPVEKEICTRVIANYARILFIQIAELRDNISFQPKYLKQVVKSRETMEASGLDTKKMDNIVAMVLGKLKMKTEQVGNYGMGSVSDIREVYEHFADFLIEVLHGKN